MIFSFLTRLTPEKYNRNFGILAYFGMILVALIVS